MTGGHLSSGSGVIHIFDTVTAQDKPPIGLGLLREVCHDALIYARRLVELTGQPQSVGSAEQSQLLFIVNLGNSLLCAAIFALGNSFAFYDLQISSAHFTFDHSHILSPSKNNYSSVNSIWSMANSRHFSKSSFLGRPDFAASLSKRLLSELISRVIYNGIFQTRSVQWNAAIRSSRHHSSIASPLF